VGRELKAGALALGVVGLLVLVAVAARGGHPTGHGRMSQREVPYAVQNSLVTLLAIVYVIAVVVVIVAAFHYRRQWTEPESRWLRNFCAVLVFMAVAIFVYWAIARSPLANQADKAQIGSKQQRSSKPVRIRPVSARHATFNWPLAFSLVGVVVLGGTIIFLRTRRPRAGTLRRTVEEELVDAVEITIDDLRRERDPRRAVVAAYASMERILAAHGLARHRAETPFEYLARVLRELRVRADAVQSLTQLFEYAKFSAHEIDAGMQEEAIAALSAVRDDLRSDVAVAA
jgi:NADH:ubiquinone oxidoreductase subunit 6 (subunit J)